MPYLLCAVLLQRRLRSEFMNFHGRIDDVYEIGCELERKRVECAIMIKAALAGSPES